MARGGEKNQTSSLNRLKTTRIFSVWFLYGFSLGGENERIGRGSGHQNAIPIIH